MGAVRSILPGVIYVTVTPTTTASCTSKNVKEYNSHYCLFFFVLLDLSPSAVHPYRVHLCAELQ
uniref:Uncharacterized protein n=1 Tax=Anopheles minimus TaxID=112268 RepID=A0A182WQF3_9DIPT